MAREIPLLYRALYQELSRRAAQAVGDSGAVDVTHPSFNVGRKKPETATGAIASSTPMNWTTCSSTTKPINIERAKMVVWNRNAG
jgi:hypothetical protein